MGVAATQAAVTDAATRAVATPDAATRAVATPAVAMRAARPDEGMILAAVTGAVATSALTGNPVAPYVASAAADAKPPEEGAPARHRASRTVAGPLRTGSSHGVPGRA